MKWRKYRRSKTVVSTFDIEQRRQPPRNAITNHVIHTSIYAVCSIELFPNLTIQRMNRVKSDAYINILLCTIDDNK